MTYSIDFEQNNLTWDIIHKADKNGGMIEQVLDNLIAWHGLEKIELETALNFIRETWGHITVDVMEEHFIQPSYCEETLYKTVTL